MKADKNTTADDPIKLDVSLQTLYPEQPEYSEYNRIAYRNKIIEPKPYERILLQAYNHREIKWQAVNEQRTRAEQTLSPDEWHTYRKADKAFRTWYLMEDYFCRQFDMFASYTQLIESITQSAVKQNCKVDSIINNKEKIRDDYKTNISRIFAVLTMEKRIFVSNDVADFIMPPKVEYHLLMFFESLIEFCKFADIDFKPNAASFQAVVDIIGFDDYTYSETKKTVLFHADQIPL